VIILAFVVLGPIVRQLVSQGGPQEKAVDTTGAGRGNQPAASAPAAETPASGQSQKRGKAPKQTTVSLDGKSVPSGSEPVVLLNPGLVRPGTKVAVSGFGFDPGAVVDVALERRSSTRAAPVAFGKIDQNGSFTASFTLPENVGSTTTVVAKERNSDKSARAQALVPGGVGTLKVGKQVGKPGDRVTLSASGFSPGEPVKVYWGTLSGQPATTLQTDSGGSLGQVSLRVPVAAVGNSTLALVGDKSQAGATSPFTVLSLYPTVKVAPYAVKAANRIGFAANGFGPDERVLVYVNTTRGAPVMTVQADSNGSFSGAGFMVPFGLKRQQSLILIGELSRAVVSSGFLVLPYTPTAQPSTYGGAPGTSLTFYASGFAPNEVVLVYRGRTHDNAGELVAAFRADGRGRAAAAGQYQIAGDEPGRLVFTLVGRQSEGVATTTVQVQRSDVPVKLGPPPKYTLPPDLQDRPAPSPATPGSRPASGPRTRETAGAQTPPATAPLTPAASAGSGQAGSGRGGKGPLDTVSKLWKSLASRR
jgi:hypothetical protein